MLADALPAMGLDMTAATNAFGELIGTYTGKALVIGLVVIAVMFLWDKLGHVGGEPKGRSKGGGGEARRRRRRRPDYLDYGGGMPGGAFRRSDD